jgi:peptide/nickel transport system permease protein
MKMLLFAAKRLGRLLLTVLLISTIIFFVIRVIPGDPALVIAGVDASPEVVANLRVKMGTDQPLGVQYVRWLAAVVRLDFGNSLVTGQPVLGMILQRFPLTLSLALFGIVIAVVLAIPLGILSAVRRWSGWDWLGMFFSQLGMAVPSFWLGILLLLGLAVRVRMFPLFGSGSLKHLVLPAVSLGLARAAILLRLTRASMIEELSREYIVTARAKGLPERMVRYKHALKNALLPVVTVAGIQLGYMLGGAVIIEQVFSLPGLGRLFLTGVYQRDFPLIQGGIVFIALVFSLINFLVDIAYSALNPRIRMG